MSVLKIKDDNGVWHDIPAAVNIYPVGSIYISTNSVSPAAIFGGTWARITGKFLLAATDGGAQGGNGNASIEAGYSGGEATHKITTSEMAAHTHGSKSLTGYLNAYTWDEGSANGIVTKSTLAKNQKATSGNQVGWIGYTITATHEHDNVGSDTAHNNMPPYLAVYVWERTA